MNLYKYNTKTITCIAFAPSKRVAFSILTNELKKFNTSAKMGFIELLERNLRQTDDCGNLIAMEIKVIILRIEK